MNTYAKPLPVPSEETLPFWEGCRRHELLVPRCTQCGARWFPPSRICPECWADDSTLERVSGRGKVFTYAMYHRLYHPGFKDELPYVVALVELEEGPRLISNVVGCPPEEVRCGLPVEVVFEDVTEETTLYKFRPRASV